MKKTSLLIFIFSVFAFSLFSQESNIIEDDDFDSIFEEAEDIEEAVDEVKEENKTPVQVFTSAFSSMVHFSGSFSGEVGAVYVHMRDIDDDDNDVSGFVSLKNTLNMTVTPVSSFAIRGSLYTGIDNGFTAEIKSLYFDYLLLNRVYISAGKKTISWGNIRLFNNTDYYGDETALFNMCLYKTGPAYANIFDEYTSKNTATLLALDIRYPWSWGTLTFAITGNLSSDIKPSNFNYYGALELSVLNTNINLYVKRPQKNAEEQIPIKSDLAGLEIKRTILGFDTYAQALVRVKDFNNLGSEDGYDYVLATAGLYRLFDSFDPNIGFNIEYQHEYNPSKPHKHYDRIAFEGGLKRIGKNKNMKIGVLSHYNFTELHGYTGLNFLLSGVLPYADWSNKLVVGYGSKYEISAFMFSTSISLALNY